MIETLRKLNNLPNLTLVGRRLQLDSAFHLDWRGVLFSLLSVGATTALMFSIGVAPYNANMVYMLVTLCATVWFSLATGVLAATLAFFCFDYFFIPPFFTLVVDAAEGWLAIFLFLGTALLANQVAGRARLNSSKAQQRAQEVTSLYELATTVITQINRQEMLQKVLKQVNEALDATSCTLFLASNDTIETQLVEAVSIKSSVYNDTFAGKDIFPRHPDVGLVQAVFNRNKAAFFSVEHYDVETMTSIRNGIWPQSIKGEVGPDSESFSNRIGPVAYLPLASSSRQLGVMVLVGRIQPRHTEFSIEERRLLEVFANHVALAVEHARLIEETALVASLRESDHFKSTLLASVSHELRTPLTAVKTAASNLQTQDIEWTGEEQQEFLTIIVQETDRLSRLVSNLLDLTKIEGGVFQPNFGWYYLPEIVEEVIERLQSHQITAEHPISTNFASDIPLVKLDYVQIDQVLTNLLENAVKYSEAGRPISIVVSLESGSADVSTSNLQILLVKIIDEGIGIPVSQLERIFDKFYRVEQKPANLASSVPGSGIGLAIAKGIIEAHGGRIWAENRIYGGTIFNFTLPITPLDFDLTEKQSNKDK